MRYLIDVNVLVGLLNDWHPHWDASTTWLAEIKEPRSIGLCWVAQMGALRILTTRSAMKEEVMEASQAWVAVATILHDDRFFWLTGEESSLNDTWAELLATLPSGSSGRHRFIPGRTGNSFRFVYGHV